MTSKKSEFPVSSEGIRSGLDALLTEADKAGVPRSIAHRIAVIVDEYCSNLIRHDTTLTADSRFTFEFAAVPDGARVVIRDDGVPFDPTTHEIRESTGIGGQGISLMRGLATELTYRSSPAGNELQATILQDPKSDSQD